MKRLRLVSMILVILLVGCESKIVDMKISKYPDSIVYVVGEATELNFDGMEIVYILKDGTRNYEDIFGFEGVNFEFFEVIHQIDFDVPGVYVVTFKRGEVECTFAIQVIDINDYLVEK